MFPSSDGLERLAVHIPMSEDRGKSPGLLSWAALQTQPASAFQNLRTVTVCLWEQADKLLPGLHKIHHVLGNTTIMEASIFTIQ